MHKYPLTAIINFCSNESRFLPLCIEEARKFAKQIIIPVCDHFFDGTIENRPLLEQIYQAYPDCLFLEYPFIPSEIPRRIFEDVTPAHFWHSCSRLIGASHLQDGIEAVLFLDADEVPDGAAFAQWLEASDYQQNTVMKLSNYWYFREPSYQALSWEDSIVLAQTRAITHDLLVQEEERDAIYNRLPGPKRRHVTGANGEPMFHHFSWVRTKNEMLKKVGAWGHKADRNWAELIEKEFSSPFQGTDFIHGYSYKTINPIFDMQLEPIFKAASDEPQVIRLTQKDLRDLLKFKKSFIWKWFSSLLS